MYSERLSTREIPQADTLDNVSDVVEFVSRGYDTYQLIAKKLGLTERQGRYYRLAAELLGFIENITHRNASRLTGLGKEFLQATKDRKQDILFAQIFKVPIVQTIIGILASSDSSANQEEISTALYTVVTDSTRSMMERRLQTILSWLGTLGIVTKSGQVVRLAELPQTVDKIEIIDPKMPALPCVDDPGHFRAVSSKAVSCADKIRHEILNARMERENAVHENLRSTLARRIRNLGTLATFNPYIDLAARINDTAFIIEAKVLNSNINDQVQNGLLQLREYRDLQCCPDAKLVLLIEKSLSKQDAQQLADEIERENGVYLMWHDSPGVLSTSERGSKSLPFLE